MIFRYLKKRSVLLTFLSAIFLIGLFVGIVLYFKCNNETKSNIINQISNIKEYLINNNINNILKHFILIIIILILSFTIIGYFGAFFYLFYEGVSISFTLAFLVKIYGFKGLIFGILYNILFKLLFLIIYVLIIIKLFSIIKCIIKNIIYKKRINIKYIIKNNISAIVILYIVMFINDIIIYFFSSIILKIILNVL